MGKKILLTVIIIIGLLAAGSMGWLLKNDYSTENRKDTSDIKMATITIVANATEPTTTVNNQKPEMPEILEKKGDLDVTLDVAPEELMAKIKILPDGTIYGGFPKGFSVKAIETHNYNNGGSQ